MWLMTGWLNGRGGGRDGEGAEGRDERVKL